MRRSWWIGSVVAVAVAVCATPASAGPRAGAQQWVRRYNASYAGADYGGLVAVAPSGDVYVAGQSFSSSPLTGDDIVVIKYSAAGAQQWVRRYNGPAGNGLDTPKAIAVDTSGNVLVTGQSYGTRGVGLPDIVTLKYTSAGVRTFAQRYWAGTVGHEEGRAVGADAAGNVYTAGIGSSPTSGTTDAVLVKYSPAGVQQWARRYGAPFNDNDGFVSMVVAPSGAVYGVGYSVTSGLNLQDVLVVKYSTGGTQQWVRTYNGTPSVEDWAETAVRTAQGNIVVAGARGEGCHDDLCYSYLTIQYTPAGVRQWVKLYAPLPESDDLVHRVAADPAGNVYVTGQSAWTSAFYDIATVKYSAAGVQQWVRRWDGTGKGNDQAYGLVVDASGNAVVSGFTYTSLAKLTDWVTLKYSASGALQWTQKLDGPMHHDDMALGNAMAADGSTYVSGFDTGDTTAVEELVVVKYAP